MAYTATDNLGIDIWKKQETISRLLRRIARSEPWSETHRLIFEKMSGRQYDMLISVNHLCDKTPKGIPLRAVAADLGISSATASVMVDALVTQGLLHRGTDPDDRRRKCIRLSPRAKEFFANGDAALQKIIRQTAQVFESDYLAKWHDILSRFEEKLKKRA
jgi:DNA-binding MarR family transcriptional regulator